MVRVAVLVAFERFLDRVEARRSTGCVVGELTTINIQGRAMGDVDSRTTSSGSTT
ncbi:hypothetical protein ACFVTM_04755 [Arthrobacter sp. NPDC058130]|uniref:hypothetical protein n=1 Tax=Arthrobacter sp. NPDC058130 TaxID=3346353 RepID=UPI0036EF9038